MELSNESRKKILKYLLSCDALKKDTPKEICEHLSRLERYEQLDALEDSNGDLVYAWAWWMLSDKTLELVKEGKAPKRFNRGKHMLGFFALVPQQIGVMKMRRVIRNAVRMERAKTFNVYTPRGKWYTIKTRYLRKPKQTPKEKHIETFFKILAGAA